MVGYLGPNGAGKSTTIKMMTGVLEPSAGEILIAGRVPYKNRTKNAQEVGVVFGQRSQLWWSLPVICILDNISELSFCNGLELQRDTFHVRFFVIGINTCSNIF
jgi:ABC-type uncharacterized transport system ATPase subunit